MKKTYLLITFCLLFLVSCNTEELTLGKSIYSDSKLYEQNEFSSKTHGESQSKDEIIRFLEEKNQELERTHKELFNYFMWLFGTIFTGSLILIHLNIRESKRKDIIIYNSEQFLKHSIQVQEAERRRISQELHDSVAQSLRYVSLLAENLSDNETAEKIISTQNENIENIRKLCYNLTPPVIRKDNFISSLEFLGQKIFETETTDFQYRVVCEPFVKFDKWDEHQLMHIYRIVQEALQNIQKHASATEATVFFKKNEAVLKIIITDDGCGMDEKLVNQINSGFFENLEVLHFGLRNIFERTKLLDGKITYFSEENSGTRLSVEI